jgi:Reverse transcriptase (RNA-dependent DNA polymerase)
MFYHFRQTILHFPLSLLSFQILSISCKFYLFFSPIKYVTLIKDMYTNVVTCVKACDGKSDIFSIKIGLHQGSALSPYIFTLVMDEITKDIQ